MRKSLLVPVLCLAIFIGCVSVDRIVEQALKSLTEGVLPIQIATTLFHKTHKRLPGSMEELRAFYEKTATEKPERPVIDWSRYKNMISESVEGGIVKTSVLWRLDDPDESERWYPLAWTFDPETHKVGLGAYGWFGPRKRPHAYEFEAMLLKAPSDAKALLDENLEGNLLQVMKREDVAVMDFPVLRLIPDERGTIDLQEKVRYPMTFTRDTEPKNFKTVGVGKLVKVLLTRSPGNLIRVSVYFEDSFITGYTALRVTRGKQYMVPVIKSSRIGASLNPTVGTWHILGEVEKGKTVEMNTLFLVRVTEKEDA